METKWAEAPDPELNRRLKDHRKECALLSKLGEAEFAKLEKETTAGMNPGEVNAFHKGIEIFMQTFCYECQHRNISWGKILKDFPQYFNNERPKNPNTHFYSPSEILSLLELYITGRHNIYNQPLISHNEDSEANEEEIT